MDGRARATDQTVDHRAQFEKAVELQKLPLKVGDCVLSGGNRCQILQHLRQVHVLDSDHEERDCEVLRAWGLKGLFCQWMMTLN